MLPSEQEETKEQQEQWLKSLLPGLNHGWWEVALNGKGFIIKQRWREQGQQTQTYPRVSREHYQTLKGSDYAKQIVKDFIFGHLDFCLTLAEKRGRARSAAQRLGLEC